MALLPSGSSSMERAFFVGSAVVCTGFILRDVFQSYFSESKKERPMVAVDLDEVLGKFVERMCEYYNGRYPEKKALSVSDFTSYNFNKVWGGTMKDTQAIVDDFMNSALFRVDLAEGLRGLDPIPGANATLLELKEHYDFSIVTSRQTRLKELTKQWIGYHFSEGVFNEILLGNHYGQSKEGKKISKPDMCESIGARVIIDDNPRYIYQCSQMDSMKLCILFNYRDTYPWSKQFDPESSYSFDELMSKPNVIICHDWDQVKQALLKLLPSF